ncbi:MAG: cbb3-type cytochrome c oxidase subunit 3 [Alphaproteobacteria bacterium]
MDWLAQHGPVLTTVCFFAGFVGIALWAYFPANKKRLEDQGKIPLRESSDDPR